MKAKGELVRAAKKLMWERGYEAVSPRDLLEKVVRGKAASITTSRERWTWRLWLSVRCPMKCASSRARPLERTVLLWIVSSAISMFPATASKVAGWADLLAKSSIAEASLRKPIERYFRELQHILAAALREAQADGEIAKRLDASELALMLITVVQGGFVVSRVYRDRTPSIGPRKWPSRCSNRFPTAKQDEPVCG